MNRIGSLSKLLMNATWIGVLTAVVLGSVNTVAQEVVIVPPEIVATTEPVYYEGHPVYWYNGRWMYRDGRGGWAWYRAEPVFLRDHRLHAPPVRRYYGGYGERGREVAHGHWR